MKYEVGDQVQYKNIIFLMDAEILEIDDAEEYNYHIVYTDYESEDHKVWVNEKDIVGFTNGTRKHMISELERLSEIYLVDDMISYLKCKINK